MLSGYTRQKYIHCHIKTKRGWSKNVSLWKAFDPNHSQTKIKCCTSQMSYVSPHGIKKQKDVPMLIEKPKLRQLDSYQTKKKSQEGHYIIIKGVSPMRGYNILNTYVPQSRILCCLALPKYTKQMLAGV